MTLVTETSIVSINKEKGVTITKMNTWSNGQVFYALLGTFVFPPTCTTAIFHVETVYSRLHAAKSSFTIFLSPVYSDGMWITRRRVSPVCSVI